jgi:streptogrisin C
MFCRYPHCSPPLRGGVAIYNDVGTATGKCTSAFVARSRSDQKLYLMTAGHCIRHVDDDAWFTRWSNRNHTIGAAHNWVFDSRGDMAILNINRPGIMKPGACVMVTSGPETTADFKYGISSDGPVVIGQRVCTTGASLGHSDCGTVNATGVTVTYSDGTTVNGLARSSLCVIPGDSGAPVFASHRAHGIISGRDGICSTLHQGIEAAENALNVDVAHGDCP